ncbi:hypothetical protein Cni_G05211 [Canna indica]|uniref:Uncharacterized protein n=1 Tax=Canna indica TaxID=4628 RepID=A0AAQ3Q592_9LILI|nr:hypothetical protein Cni_G05211 [Canna indica]
MSEMGITHNLREKARRFSLLQSLSDSSGDEHEVKEIVVLLRQHVSQQTLAASGSEHWGFHHGFGHAEVIRRQELRGQPQRRYRVLVEHQAGLQLVLGVGFGGVVRVEDLQLGGGGGGVSDGEVDGDGAESAEVGRPASGVGLERCDAEVVVDGQIAGLLQGLCSTTRSCRGECYQRK